MEFLVFWKGGSSGAHHICPEWFFSKSSSNDVITELFSRFYSSFPFSALLCFTLAKYKISNLEIFFFSSPSF